MRSEKVQAELLRVQQLLYKEKEEDLLQYKSRTAATSYKHRRKTGVCWYPVMLEKSNYDNGERLIVKVSRAKEHVQSDAFQSGKLVSLFSAHKNTGEELNEVSGVVNNVKECEMFITLNCDELPLWIHDGVLGVQLLFDENSYKEMEFALRQVLKNEDKRLERLSNVILGELAADFDLNHSSVELEALNSTQNMALNKVLSSKDVAIIHGPPGTGKTTTIVQCIKEVVKTEAQVLVCAPSNAAVDLLVEKLNANDIKAIRLGHPARVTEEALGFTLDAKVAQHKDFKTLKQLRKKAEEYFTLGGKWKRNFGRDEREQRGMLLSEARKLKKDAEHLSDFISGDIIEKCQVIACTLVGSSSRKLKGKKFETVFIDEAGQSLEPASWIPILKANRVIFAGDHQQLPPTVKSYQAGKEGLKVTLFEKAIARNQASTMLIEQYRMHEQIMQFSSEKFYKGALIANKNVKNHLIFEGDKPVEFIDTAGTGFNESVDPDSRSTYNKEEAQLAIKHLETYFKDLAINEIEATFSIGIISPYRAQIEVLSDLLLTSEISPAIVSKIKINTIDSFQGQERDIIYISLVRSNDKGEIGFLSDERRMNVAMTRARKKLVMVGDSATVCRHKLYEELLDYVNEIGAYRSAFELMY